jgi:DnaJ-class molecular chaperone
MLRPLLADKKITPDHGEKISAGHGVNTLSLRQTHLASKGKPVMATHICPNCDGSKILTEPCPLCKELTDIYAGDCPSCEGDGWIETKCPHCGGTGRVEDQNNNLK